MHTNAYPSTRQSGGPHCPVASGDTPPPTRPICVIIYPVHDWEEKMRLYNMLINGRSSGDWLATRCRSGSCACSRRDVAGAQAKPPAFPDPPPAVSRSAPSPRVHLTRENAKTAKTPALPLLERSGPPAPLATASEGSWNRDRLPTGTVSCVSCTGGPALRSSESGEGCPRRAHEPRRHDGDSTLSRCFYAFPAVSPSLTIAAPWALGGTHPGCFA